MRTSKVSLAGTFLVILSFVLAACAPAATQAPTAVIPVTGATGTPGAGASNASNSSGGSSNSGSTLNVGNNPKFGSILVGPSGMTLYEFAGDTSGVSKCNNTCIQTWPPLGVPGGLSPVLGYGVGGDLSTIIRPDGSAQVTLNGAPLYYFTGDRVIGDANGEGFGGKWFVVAPDGSRVKSGGVFTPTTPVSSATATPAAATPSGTPTVPAVPAGSSTPTSTPASSG
jgi:predicted lipoprotein with Yx(FWY)xxD motif